MFQRNQRIGGPKATLVLERSLRDTQNRLGEALCHRKAHTLL